MWITIFSCCVNFHERFVLVVLVARWITDVTALHFLLLVEIIIRCYYEWNFLRTGKKFIKFAQKVSFQIVEFLNKENLTYSLAARPLLVHLQIQLLFFEISSLQMGRNIEIQTFYILFLVFLVGLVVISNG